MIEIRIYKTVSKEEPFTTWLHKLKDAVTRSRVRRRLDRLSLGNEGDFKSLGNGIFELRLTFGPGYRIYYGKQHQKIVILLCGGSKGTQTKDIKLARKYWADFNKGINDE